MFDWLRRLREASRRAAEDANRADEGPGRAAARPRPIEELVRHRAKFIRTMRVLTSASARGACVRAVDRSSFDRSANHPS